MTGEEFFALPALSSHFPLVYGNGARWNSMSGQCNGCRATFPDEMFRGRVTRPFPRVYVIDGIGFCEPCNLMSRCQYRVYDDMSLVGRDREGEWARWAGRPSRWSRFRKWLRGLFA